MSNVINVIIVQVLILLRLDNLCPLLAAASAACYLLHLPSSLPWRYLVCPLHSFPSPACPSPVHPIYVLSVVSAKTSAVRSASRPAQAPPTLHPLARLPCTQPCQAAFGDSGWRHADTRLSPASVNIRQSSSTMFPPWLTGAVETMFPRTRSDAPACPSCHKLHVPSHHVHNPGTHRDSQNWGSSHPIDRFRPRSRDSPPQGMGPKTPPCRFDPRVSQVRRITSVCSSAMSDHDFECHLRKTSGLVSEVMPSTHVRQGDVDPSR